MNWNHMRRSAMTGALIYAVLGVLTGIFLVAVHTAFLLKAIFIIMGVLTLLLNVPMLLSCIGRTDTAAGKLSLLLSLIAVVVGAMMLFWHTGVLFVILGIYLLLAPIVRILLSKDRSAQLRREVPTLILGTVLILLGPASVLDILFDIAGGIIILLSILYLVFVYLSVNKHQNTPGARIFVDTDGNGTIDTVYVDTTGDGKADTATDYKEKQ